MPAKADVVHGAGELHRAAERYSVQGMGTDAVADRFGLPRPTVLRMLPAPGSGAVGRTAASVVRHLFGR